MKRQKELIMSLRYTFLFSLSFIVFSATQIHAQTKSTWGGPGFDFRKKAESKEGTRWTLQEWMAQKEKNHIMDLWLGMYAPSPFEFFISGSHHSYNSTLSTMPASSPETSNSFKSYQGAIGAYAMIIGLQGEYENNWEEQYNDLSGSINLRVLGNAIQGTHLLLQLGQRTRNLNSTTTNPLKLSNTFTGAELDIYLMKYFGLHGLYRSYLPNDETSLGQVSGTRSEAGMFIDFNAVRIYGNWFSDKQESLLSGTITKRDRTGIMTGIKFFF